MASAAAETATIPTNTDTPSNQVPEAPRGGLRHRGRGGRGRSGRGRGRGGPHNEDGTIGTGDRGGVENRGRGRPPRGGLHMQTPQTSVNSSVAPKTDSAPAEGSTDDAADESLCFICANPVQFYSVTICNHTTCHICSLRMRALYGNKACAHCRVS